MALSALQKSILKECYVAKKPRVPRSLFQRYYQRKNGSNATLSDSITVSLERLIDRGLLVGFGRRTPKKWFIEEVRLTSEGRRASHKILGQQQKLPLRLKGS